MKVIGLLGGMSWVATVPYYSRLNELAVERLGSPNSARVILYNVNYAPLKTLYHDGWHRIPQLYLEEYQRLDRCQPDCIILACNTLHKAHDIVESRLESTTPFFHAVHLTTEFMDAHKLQRPLFIGTKFTMTDDYFQGPLRASGLTLTLPTEREQTIIQDIQQQVSAGVTNARQKENFAEIIANHPLVDSVILACTELPLIAPESTPNLPIINPAELQCQAAIEFACQSACKLDLASLPNQTVRSPR